MDASLVQYYRRRTQEYDRIWQRDDPLRQAEQTAVADALKDCLQHRHVLEVACGTGFWTGFAAEVAASVCAIDVAPEMLALAQARKLPPQCVQFRLGDAYALDKIPGDFDAGLANFWFSHIPKAQLQEFLTGFHRRIGAGAVVFMADNVYVPGIGGELMTHPGVADTYKLRELADGSKHQVLKNYYDAEEIREVLAPRSSNLEVRIGKCFWWVRYRVAS